MMTLANYGIKSGKHKDPASAKSLHKSLQLRNRAESTLKQYLKASHKLTNDSRQDILDSIEDYYARVPFDMVIWNKAQVKQCVVDSILSLDYKFNPYKAREAFHIIESMLLNLHHLPWHPEFTKIVTYSGKFRQDVSTPLVGAEDVLMAAGFQRGSGELSMHLILNQHNLPLTDCSEHITQVIFDCMLSQVIMSDFINVIESSCKSSKLGPNELSSSSEINCYLWIQSYFRERSTQITEKACANIQELLNNITNHLAKQRMVPKKISTRVERPIDTHPSNSRINETSQTTRKELDVSPTLIQRQENVRRALAYGSLEDTNLLKLSDDLLKLPDDCDSNDANTGGLYPMHQERLQHISHQDIPYHDSDAVAELHERRGGSSSHLERSHLPPRCVPRSEEFDVADSMSARPSTSHDRDYGHPGHPSRVDLPHNDRELLIPKRDRRLNQEHMNGSRQPVRNFGTYHGNKLPGYAPPDPIVSISGAGGHLSGRHHFDEYPPLQDLQASQSPQLSSKNASSRYDRGINHTKYEGRDFNRPTFSRAHWSCSSCTFYNHPANELCEICGFRKPL